MGGPVTGHRRERGACGVQLVTMSATTNAHVHPTAVVDPECELAPGVEIGPWCVLSGRVKLGPGVRLIANVHICGPASVGENTIFYPFACIGFPPQDYKFKIGDATAGVTIGKNTIIREYATVHAATKPDVPTRIGDRVMMMVNSHVGHDGQIGNSVILANGALVAGHAQVQDNVMMSGNTAIHQFTRVGRMAFISGGQVCVPDVPPFCIVGSRNTIHTVNLIGMRRNGLSRDDITAVRNAFWHVLCLNLPRKETVALLEERGKDSAPVMEMARFIAESKRTTARGIRRDDEDLG